MKVWISKYALTQGIYEVEVRETTIVGMVAEVSNNLAIYHGEGVEWHKTKTSAQAKSIEMKNKKIKSLEKQLVKIKGLEF